MTDFSTRHAWTMASRSRNKLGIRLSSINSEVRYQSLRIPQHEKAYKRTLFNGPVISPVAYAWLSSKLCSCLGSRETRYPLPYPINVSTSRLSFWRRKADLKTLQVSGWTVNAANVLRKHDSLPDDTKYRTVRLGEGGHDQVIKRHPRSNGHVWRKAKELPAFIIYDVVGGRDASYEKLISFPK